MDISPCKFCSYFNCYNFPYCKDYCERYAEYEFEELIINLTI